MFAVLCAVSGLTMRNDVYMDIVLIIVSLVFVLSGCKNGFPKMPETRENQDYPKAQAMIVVATERNRYEKTYTDQIWDVTLENGQKPIFWIRCRTF